MKVKSLPRYWIERHRFGFLAQMSRRNAPLLLLKGGFWTIPSLSGWSTDIDVVTEADKQGYLTKLIDLPDSCLAGRLLTTKGHEFANELVHKYPPSLNPRSRPTSSRDAAPSSITGTVNLPSPQDQPIRPPVLTVGNLEILRRIEQQILADPNCFTLRACCESIPEFKTRACPEKYPKSGFIACLAGLACFCIAKGKGNNSAVFFNKSHKELARTAAIDLGLTSSEADRLFSHWSFDVLREYRQAVSQNERARIAVSRIEKFIHTGQ